MIYAERFRRLMNDDSVSYALKDAMLAFDKRDALDALYDADTLLELMHVRLLVCCRWIPDPFHGDFTGGAFAPSLKLG